MIKITRKEAIELLRDILSTKDRLTLIKLLVNNSNLQLVLSDKYGDRYCIVN